MKLLRSEEDIYDIVTTLLQLIGEYKSYISRRIVLYRILNCLVMVFLLIFIFSNFLRIKGGMYVNTFESFVTVIHPLLKYLLFIYYKQDIEKILYCRENIFWKYQNFDEDISGAVASTYKFVKLIQITSFLTAFVVMYLFFLKPCFSQEHVYLLETWVFVNSTVLDAVVLMCQYYFLYVCLVIVIFYDFIYLSLCVDMVSQVRLLKYRLKRFSFDMKTINTYIEYHQLLLSTFAKMRRIYSLMLLFHYFVTLVSTCSDMYETLVGHTDRINTIIKTFAILFIFGQFACYAIPAELVASEFSSLSDTIYMSKWYENSLAIQKLLLFIMGRSQRVEYFSGAGLMHINIAAFASVIRKTFSFYAILRNLLNQ